LFQTSQTEHLISENLSRQFHEVTKHKHNCITSGLHTARTRLHGDSA